MTPKDTAIMSLDCLDGHRKNLRALISADAPLDQIIKQTQAMGEMLANSVQMYVADRQGWRGKKKE